jgi:LAS superfamily LD-carboxypeptidase LdcB
MKKTSWSSVYILVTFLVVFLVTLGYLGFEYKTIKKEFSALQKQIVVEQNKNKQLEEDLSEAKVDNIFLSETLYAEENKNSVFEEQIREISSTVGDLDKLSKTDQELLQKYSKVYFLNEHYIPESLSEIDSKYLYNQSEFQTIHTKALSYLEALIQAVEKDDITLKIISAFRSFGEQSAIKSGYAVTYGAGTANQFSADQGYSEHQLGTAVDFTTPETGDNFLKFEQTDAYMWLSENAYKYGFILSYPEDNGYYQFEPWHWRFVGAALANKLRIDRKNFYDLNQREIDQYLIHIFD